LPMMVIVGLWTGLQEVEFCALRGHLGGRGAYMTTGATRAGNCTMVSV
jgi:hypothetical protein